MDGTARNLLGGDVAGVPTCIKKKITAKVFFSEAAFPILCRARMAVSAVVRRKPPPRVPSKSCRCLTCVSERLR